MHHNLSRNYRCFNNTTDLQHKQLKQNNLLSELIWVQSSLINIQMNLSSLCLPPAWLLSLLVFRGDFPFTAKEAPPRHFWSNTSLTALLTVLLKQPYSVLIYSSARKRNVPLPLKNDVPGFIVQRPYQDIIWLNVVWIKFWYVYIFFL